MPKYNTHQGFMSQYDERVDELVSPMTLEVLFTTNITFYRSKIAVEALWDTVGGRITANRTLITLFITPELILGTQRNTGSPQTTPRALEASDTTSRQLA